MELRFFLLPLVMASRCFSSPQQFMMDIEERGWEFTEVLEVDEEANTELIQVPHHNEVEATTFLHDFNKNVTLRIIRDTGACYLTDLSEMIDNGYLVPPKQMKQNLHAGQLSQRPVGHGSDQPKMTSLLQDWTFGPLVTDEEMEELSQEMRDACPSSTIHWLIRLRDSANVRSGTTPRHGTSQNLLSRQRRNGGNYTPNCPVAHLKYRCQRKILSCQYIYYENCEAERVNLSRRRAHCRDKNTLHIIDQVQCCRECCDSEEHADDFFRYCNTLENFSCYN